MMPRCDRSPGLSSRDSLTAMRAMVSGWPVRSATIAVPVTGVRAVPVFGTGTRKFPCSARALLSAFSILLISDYPRHAQHSNGCRESDCRHHGEHKHGELYSQAFQLPWGPQMGNHRRDWNLVPARNRIPDADARIKLQTGVKQAHGNQQPQQNSACHEMPESQPTWV